MTEGCTIYYGNVWFYCGSTIKTKQGNFLSILRFIITEQSGQWANWTFSVILHIYLLKFEPRVSCWQTSVMYYSSNSPSRRKIETSYWNWCRAGDKIWDTCKMWDYNIGMGSRDKNAVQPHKVRHLRLQRFKVKRSCNESESIFMQCREKHASMRRLQWTAQSETSSRFLSVWVRLGWSVLCHNKKQWISSTCYSH